MNPTLYRENTRLIVILFSGLLALTLIRIFYNTVAGTTLPLDKGLVGFVVIGVLFAFYQNNNLWSRITANPWVLLFCVYIALSFAFGLYRYRTVRASLFDLWLFAFIPGVMLLPIHSFNWRMFDRMVALCVVIGSIGMAAVVALRPDALFDRGVFAENAGLLGALAAGHVYLILKYAVTVNVFTYIGLFGTLVNGVVYGVIGAFRGHLLLSALALLLFFGLQLMSRRVNFAVKFVTLSAATVLCAIGVFLALTRFEEQTRFVTDRFTGMATVYERQGDIFLTDGRWNEIRYFRSLNPDYKLILGHGVGGMWWDFFGMFAGRTEFGGDTGAEQGFAGARTVLHVNWIHIPFKIGFVGSFLLIGMIVSHCRKHPHFIRQNPAWWAFLIFYAAWTTYYGDKELTARSVIWLMIIVHPWLFKATGTAVHGHPQALRKDAQRMAPPAPMRGGLRPQPVPALRRAFPPPPG